MQDSLSLNPSAQADKIVHGMRRFIAFLPKGKEASEKAAAAAAKYMEEVRSSPAVQDFQVSSWLRSALHVWILVSVLS